MKFIDNKNTLMIVSGNMQIGGLQKETWMFATHFASLGWSVKILALFQKTSESAWELPSNVEVIPMKARGSLIRHKVIKLPLWVNFIRKEIRRSKPSFILCMTPRIGTLVVFAAPSYAKKIIVKETSDPASPARSKIMNKFMEISLSRIKGFIFQNKWEQSCYGEKIREKSIIVYNPCKINIAPAFTYDSRIVTASRLDNVSKRIDVAIKIFDKLSEKYPQMIFEIYGDGQDKDMLVSLANSLKSKEKIHFMGEQRNVITKLIGARCFLFTSDYEGMPNSLIEANLAGIPCVSSNWNGIDSVITDGINGFVYQKQNIDEAVQKMSSLIDDERLCIDLSKNGAARKEDYDPYKNLLKQAEFIYR